MTTTPTPASQPFPDTKSDAEKMLSMRADYDRQAGATRGMLSQPSPAPGVVYVCPERDIECGRNPKNWCAKCPQQPSPARSDMPDTDCAPCAAGCQMNPTGDPQNDCGNCMLAERTPSSDSLREAFDAAFLSWNGFHTKAELDAEWAHGTLAGEMFRAGTALARRATAGTPTIDTPELRVKLSCIYAAGVAKMDPSGDYERVIRHIDERTTAPEKPFAGPGAWFSVDILGNPMRQYAPGKWENAVWPSSVAGTTAPAPATALDAAAFIEKRAAEYLQENASTEHDTGAVVFHYGEAGREYHSTLVELAEEIRGSFGQSRNRRT